MSPSYKRTLGQPIWAVYQEGELIATCRAHDLPAAEDKLAEFRSADESRRLVKIGEWPRVQPR